MTENTILAIVVFAVSFASYVTTFHVGKSKGYQDGYDTGYLAGYKHGFFEGDAKAYLRHCANAQGRVEE